VISRFGEDKFDANTSTNTIHSTSQKTLILVASFVLDTLSFLSSLCHFNSTATIRTPTILRLICVRVLPLLAQEPSALYVDPVKMADPKTFKQDMVVSIRYRNDLPPPPMPPKLLDIDTGGLAQYLTTGYASGLAKREEPNIEVDAEGGMPIDMIGVPHYFLGDESAIMAPEIQPVLDPADQALMLSLDQLKSQGAKNNVSFLRKTQYMTASQIGKSADPFIKPSPRPQKTTGPKPAPVPVSRDDPENIKRQIQKGFNLAYPDTVSFNPEDARANNITGADRTAWELPKHPDNHRLTPVEFYPVLPDLEAGTDLASNWQALKFDKPPLPPLKNGRRDDRIDVGLLMAAENPERMPDWRAKKDAFDANPDDYPDPGPEPYAWSLSIPKKSDSTSRIRQAFDDSNPSKDDPSLTSPLLEEGVDGAMRIPFERVKVYPNASRSETDPRRIVALSLVDTKKVPPHSRFHKQSRSQNSRMAFYYPIFERVKMKVDRGVAKKSLQEQQSIEENLPDQMMVSFREPDVLERHIRAEFRGRNDLSFKHQWEQLEKEADEERERMRQAEGDADDEADVHMADGQGDHDSAPTNGVDRRDATNGEGRGRGGGAVDGDGDAEEDEDMQDD
jgi:RNA polymerase II-associated factor 1